MAIEKTFDGYIWKPDHTKNLRDNWYHMLRRDSNRNPGSKIVWELLKKAMKTNKIKSSSRPEVGDFVLRLQRVDHHRYEDYRKEMVQYWLHFKIYEAWKKSVYDLMKKQEGGQDGEV